MKQERQREIKRRRVLRREEIGGVKSDGKPKPNWMLLTCNSRFEDRRYARRYALAHPESGHLGSGRRP